MALPWQVSAEHVMATNGWLSRQPLAFRAEVLRRSELLRTEPGEIVYSRGDPPGGMHGLIAGTAMLDLLTEQDERQGFHVVLPGSWVGESAFFTHEPRNTGLRSLTAASMLHLPLGEMRAIVALDPEFHRCFATNMIATAFTLMQTAHDLQRRHPHERIASVLGRDGSGMDLAIPQSELARMANVSRRQTGAALRIFVDRGWLQLRYRGIRILDADALRAFSGGDGAEAAPSLPHSRDS